MLKGKKVAMTWAYSPSYGKLLSVPQGIIGLMSRIGMDLVLIAKKQSSASGGKFRVSNSMEEALT